MNGLQIVSTGRALPSKVVTNDDLSRLVDTSDEWITTRTGIRQRYFCQEGEDTSQLAAAAASLALSRAGIRGEDLAACIVATSTPEYCTPSTACQLQQKLGLPEDLPFFDLSAGCTGFIYGLRVARGLLLQDPRPYALVVGAEALSRILDFNNRSVCVLFGDGAAAAVIRLDDRPYASVLGARGNPEALSLTGPGIPLAVRMDGKAVFRFAVEAIPRCVHTLLDQSGLTLDQIDWFVPHQANGRIIASAAKRLGVPPERFYQNMERYANTSAASIPIALDEMYEQGLIQAGQKILCVGFGAGLTWGGVLICT